MGYTDWRLPNIKELQSLVEHACEAPAINSSMFPQTGNSDSAYWSSTPYNLGNYAWIVDFAKIESAGSDLVGAKLNPYSVRLVRDWND